MFGVGGGCLGGGGGGGCGCEDLIKYHFLGSKDFLLLSLYGFRCIQADSLRRAPIL
jgi:hypothetical protein